jgi:hypothetical protein
MTNAEEKIGQRNQEEKKQKKAYSSPKLIEYGDVRKLTESTGTKQGDGAGSHMP